MDFFNNAAGGLAGGGLQGLLGVLQSAGAGPGNMSELARRQKNQNLANSMLAAAAGLLTPSPNRYPLGPLQRMGAGLGAALGTLDQSEGEGAEYGGGEPLASLSHAPKKAMARTGRVTAGAELTSTRSASGKGHPSRTPRRAARTGIGPVPQAQMGEARLRRFTGTLSHRLEHPAILPGGWQLYGYEDKSGSPVYVGPGRQLRIYS
jgi:hypothetical protein